MKRQFALMLCLALGALAPCGAMHTARAAETPPAEYFLKAAFIYNIAKFVAWPGGSFDNEASPVVLCVLGRDPFGNALSTIEGKRVQGRAITIRRAAKTEDIGVCHILFISSSEAAKLPQALASLKDSRVLTISDMPNFAQAGGIIGLITTENKIRMEINMAAAERARLQISSQLLKLAKIFGG